MAPVTVRRLSNRRPSIFRLRFELLATLLIIWTVTLGHDAQLTVDTHRHLTDCYQRLADLQRLHGRASRAQRLQDKADTHRELSGDDDGPYAAAMAMPKPASWTFTDAVSRDRVPHSDDIA